MPRVIMYEASIQRAVTDYAKKQHDAICIKLTTLGRFGTSGWPDYLFLFPMGKVLFIEFKSPGCVPTELQKLKHAELRKRGFVVHVCDNAEMGREVVREVASA